MVVIFKLKFLSIVITICIVCCSTATAKEPSKNDKLEIDAPSAILIDGYTGKILFEKNAFEVRSGASLMKIMNLLIAAESLEKGEINLNDKITPSKEAEKTPGPGIWLKSGEIISTEDLIKSIGMISANDACVVLAQHIKGSEGKFVNKMNEKAAKLNMKNTIFKNCIGEDSDGNISTAYDIALMSKELMQHDNVASCLSTWIDHIRGGNTQIVNTNKLIKSCNYITGIKTGSSKSAGSCIAVSAQKGDIKLIGVLLGSDDTKKRNKEILEMVKFGFEKFVKITPHLPNDFPEKIKISNSLTSEAKIYVDLNKNFLINKKDIKNISSNVTLNSVIEAPLEKNQKIGEITYSLGNETLQKCDIKISQTVNKITFSAVFNQVLNCFFKM